MGIDNHELNGRYSGFGKVIEGFKILDDIQKVETYKIDVGVQGVEVNEPVIPEIIQSVSVDTLGVIYDKPIIINSSIYL